MAGPIEQLAAQVGPNMTWSLADVIEESLQRKREDEKYTLAKTQADIERENALLAQRRARLGIQQDEADLARAEADKPLEELKRVQARAGFENAARAALKANIDSIATTDPERAFKEYKLNGFLAPDTAYTVEDGVAMAVTPQGVKIPMQPDVAAATAKSKETLRKEAAEARQDQLKYQRELDKLELEHGYKIREIGARAAADKADKAKDLKYNVTDTSAKDLDMAYATLQGMVAEGGSRFGRDIPYTEYFGDKPGEKPSRETSLIAAAVADLVNVERAMLNATPVIPGQMPPSNAALRQKYVDEIMNPATGIVVPTSAMAGKNYKFDVQKLNEYLANKKGMTTLEAPKPAAPEAQKAQLDKIRAQNKLGPEVSDADIIQMIKAQKR